MWNDPIVAETRELRDQIALRYNYDVLALGKYFKAKRAADAKKLIVQAVKAMEQTQNAHLNVESISSHLTATQVIDNLQFINREVS